MFALLAVAFGSYVQPIAVLVAIPFGIVGAVIGHLLLGYDFSLSSVLGLVALAGVVVNDSLLLVVTINETNVRDPMTQTTLNSCLCCRCTERRRM